MSSCTTRRREPQRIQEIPKNWLELGSFPSFIQCQLVGLLAALSTPGLPIYKFKPIGDVKVRQDPGNIIQDHGVEKTAVTEYYECV